MIPLGVLLFFAVFKQSDASILVGFKYAPFQKFLLVFLCHLPPIKESIKSISEAGFRSQRRRILMTVASALI